MTELTPKEVVDRFTRAKERRSVWESHWQYEVVAEAVAATTFKVRAGIHAATSTMWLHGDSAGARVFFGAGATSITVDEIKA